jgi:Glycosyltransferase sugar-binding region containing DXD motif
MEPHQGSSSRRKPCLFVACVGLLGVCIVLGIYFTMDGRSSRSLMLSWESASSSKAGSVRVLVGTTGAAGAAGASTGLDPPPNGVFGPMSSASSVYHDQSVRLYTRDEQREFLVARGRECQQAFSSNASANLLLQRFDQLVAPYGTELWKYCAIYTGFGKTYVDPSVTTLFVLLDDIVKSSENVAVALESKIPVQLPLHHGFFQFKEVKSKVALGMIRFLLEATNLNPKLLSETLGLFVANDREKHKTSWTILTAKCAQAGQSTGHHGVRYPEVKGVDMGSPCTARNNRPCCQVYRAEQQSYPVLSLLHSHLVGTSSAENPLPFFFQKSHPTKDSELGMPLGDIPFIATMRSFPTGAPPAKIDETPNFFDILLHNDCLPVDKECYKCLKLGYKEGDEGGDCDSCATKCPCYCKALCQIRPPPKVLAAEWVVTPPRFRKDPTRLVPRVIHQTWFEPVSKEKYPNMSRLIESFHQSGWDYEFYDDDKAAQFISAHFPPEVRQAYDAIIPGAFKADLFRYCVLLIRGGVYADMDILLESNLDRAIPPDVGFLTAQDSPGETIGHRSCLWNGLMAAAPGHPFLAQTIQNVVNNARNRFTSIDYDDMLCPNPVLAVSHTVDTLFTCGPCILGASLNDVLKLHRQTGFVFGEINLFAHEKINSIRSIEADDPRLAIPGRSILLRQNKADMGSHRFTNADENLIVAVTDMPEYDDRPKSIAHYSTSSTRTVSARTRK